MIVVHELGDDVASMHLNALAGVLHDCVHDGASVGFISPFPLSEAQEFWTCTVIPQVRNGGRVLWGAFAGERLIGTVQLVLDTPPNQAHRCEVAKLLVAPQFRGKGAARLLMQTLEARARDIGKGLITLDTRSGDGAQSLYSSLGYEIAGSLPGFCRDPFEDRFDATTYMYKSLN